MADLVILYDASTGSIKGGLADTAQLANAAVTSGKIASGQVGSLHVAPAAIISSLIGSGQIGGLHIAPSSIISAKIASGQVGSLHIAPAAIISGLIASGQVGPSHLSPAPAYISSGSYAGDSSVNRAIPHGLGVTPKIVFLINELGSINFRIFGSLAEIRYFSDTAVGLYAVTIPDSTNFYVGNDASYANSANVTSRTYYWVAIG